MNGVLPQAMILTLGLQVHLYTPRENPERRNLATRLPALPPPALWLSQANSALAWISLLLPAQDPHLQAAGSQFRSSLRRAAPCDPLHKSRV